MANPYKTYNPPAGEGGLYLKLEDGDQVKIRIVGEPVVYIDRWGNTRYAWKVYNHDAEAGMVFQQAVTGYRAIAAYAQDEDWGDPTTYDLKVSRDGTGKNTKYHITPVPNSKPLTKDQQAKADEVDLSKAIKGGVPLSEAAKGKEPEAPEDSEPPEEDVGEFSDQDAPI